MVACLSLIDYVKNVVQAMHQLSFLYKTVEAGERSYRIRYVSNGNRKLKPAEMFHVPLNKRMYILTNRYSVPGCSCLYLGKSIYGCWEEMGRPHFDDCVASRVETNDTLHLLDLSIPSYDDFEANKMKYAFSFPLIIASMIQTKDRAAPFKPEYIMPQLLMSMIRSGKFGDAGNNGIVEGIYYTSVHKNHEFGFPDHVFDNMVIPVSDYDSTTDYCPQLASKFRLTMGANVEIEKLKSPKPIDCGGASPEDCSEYETSDFGYLEKRLATYNVETVVAMPK